MAGGVDGHATDKKGSHTQNLRPMILPLKLAYTDKQVITRLRGRERGQELRQPVSSPALPPIIL